MSFLFFGFDCYEGDDALQLRRGELHVKCMDMI